VSTRPRARALLLDLDGTLLDTAPDMVAALNAIRAEDGLPALPFAALRPFVSHGAAGLVGRGFPDALDAARDALRSRFVHRYRDALSHGTRLFDGCAALLARLEAAGVPWGIVTNKPGWLTTPLLADLGLATRAACVVSGDTLAVRKPDPAPLLHAAALLGVPPASCVYAGDAERDIIAGRAAGMRTVAVGWGYYAEGEDPRAWRPDAMVGEPRALAGELGLDVDG
jgi:phosphoglycolate phosphatase